MGQLLDQLRIQRDQKENEIKAPVIKALNEERREKETAVRKYQEIEFKLGEDIIECAMEQAKQELAMAVMKQLIEALHSGEDKDITFKFSTSYLRMALPDKILQDILEEYKHQARPSLSISKSMDNAVETILIKIPQLALNIKVHK